MENVRNHRDIRYKVITTEARRNYLVSEPNHTTIVSKKLLAIEIKKTNIYE